MPSKASGKVGTAMCSRGIRLATTLASKRLLQLAGVEDVYTQSKGSTATMGNFLKATFAAVCRFAKLLSFIIVIDTIERSQKHTLSLHPTFGEKFLRPNIPTTSTRRIFNLQRRRLVCTERFFFLFSFDFMSTFMG